MSRKKVKTNEEKRADLIIKYRGLKIEKEERDVDRITYYLTQGEKNYVMLCLLNQKTIGIAFIRELKEVIDNIGAD